MEDIRNKPGFTAEDAEHIAWEHFGIPGSASALPSERDQNFKITGEQQSVVIKIANPDTELGVLELENAAIQIALGLDTMECPRLIRSKAGFPIVDLLDSNKRTCRARCISFLPGVPLAEFKPHSVALFNEIGRLLGGLDRGLTKLNQNLAAKREIKWDLKNAASIVRSTKLDDAARQKLLEHFLGNFERIESRIDGLRKSVIHNDANDYNILVHHDPASDQALVGLIDYGDIVFSTTINELAIAAAYAVLGKQNPVDAAEALVAGYHESNPLDESELSVLFPLICMRLCQSVCIAAEQQKLVPDNEYLGVTEKPAWEALERLAKLDPSSIHLRFTEACLKSPAKPQDLNPKTQNRTGLIPKSEIQSIRSSHLAPSLSISYDKPLYIVRGSGQYLYDELDVTYLDCVNNVCHVGHCHPHVVKAASAQMTSLNTNTRYLHENIVRYAQRLVGKFPDPLEVCFFVNSGSEANDLALRLARTFTKQNDVLVLDHAYHGHVSAMIDISPYKFNHKGGSGKPDHVHVAPAPDGYRGPIKSDDPECGIKYAQLAKEQLENAEAANRKIGAFFAESLLGCGGQVPLPSGFLSEVYKTVRAAGGVCIADEVQVGFGRVGTHFWGFEQSDVVPDIVTLGKPIGNGHPLAAVVTTREIADAFNNGMEYFNTFGGNPVSCAIGMAVLDVIENEGLQDHALEVGTGLLESLGELKSEFESVGDVRGSGFFLGIELVKCRETLEPATELAHDVVQKMRQRRILLSTDGPLENVIKFKPPMVFSHGDAERVAMTIRETLRELSS